jgi:hypothetical protein
VGGREKKEGAGGRRRRKKKKGRRREEEGRKKEERVPIESISIVLLGMLPHSVNIPPPPILEISPAYLTG